VQEVQPASCSPADSFEPKYKKFVKIAKFVLVRCQQFYAGRQFKGYSNLTHFFAAS